MKKITLITIFVIGILVSGCSRQTAQNPASTTPTPSNTDDQQISTELKNVKFIREQLTDPDLYNFLQASDMGSGVGKTTNLNSDEQKKIGLIGKFTKSTKYGFSGTAKIISADTIRLDTFSYNGGCGNLIIALTNQNNLENYIVKVKTISTPVSSVTMDIPINISLIKFDSVSAYCPDNSQPISTATF